MTSQKSLHNAFSKTFWHTVRGNMYLPAAIASLFVVGVASLASYLRSGRMAQEMSYFGENTANTSGNIKFSLIGSEYSSVEALLVIHILLAFAAVMLAVMIFKFVNSKKTVNVWFGLGISKTALFCAKMLGGVFLLCAMIFLPALLDLMVNVREFGFSYELFMSWLYVMSGFTAYTLNIFMLFTAVICVVGTNIEGVFFGGILLLTPTLVYYEISALMNALTLGSEFRGGLVFRLKDFNPILFLLDTPNFSSLTKNSDEISFIWSMPPFLKVVMWLCAVILIAAAAGILFKKRKTEIAGFWGSSKPMTFIMSQNAALFAFCVTVKFTQASKAGAIIIGLIISAAVFLAFSVLLTLSKHEWIKNLRILPVQTAALAALGAVFATGLLGYSKRLPDLDAVKEIAITPIVNNNISSMSEYGYNPGAFGFSSADFYYMDYVLNLSSDGDKRLASEIHRMFIEADIINPGEIKQEAPRSDDILYSPIKIEYTLKNGSKLKRCYNYVPMSIFKAYGELNFGDWYKDAVKKYLTEPVSIEDSEETNLNKLFFQDNDNAVYIVSKHFGKSFSMLRMTDDQRSRLLEAVANDLINSSADVKQKPLTRQLGVLTFTHDSIKDIDSPQEREAAENEYGEIIDGYKGYVYNRPLVYYDTENVEYDVRDYFVNNTSTDIMITDEMTETLSFLVENGFSELLDFGKEIVSAQVYSMYELAAIDDAAFKYMYMGESYALNIQFNGKFWYGRLTEHFEGAHKITDPAAIETLETHSYSSYYTDDDVYFVCFEFSDKAHSIVCVPAKLMPEDFTP